MSLAQLGVWIVAADTPPEAALIAQRIEAQGIPKREVARRTGRPEREGRPALEALSEGTLRRIIGPRTDIERPAGTVARFAAVLGISPAELAGAGREDAAGALSRQRSSSRAWT